MKERPILFSGPMVRAILDGRKTQTRRVIKPPRWSIPSEIYVSKLISGKWWVAVPDDCGDEFRIHCPHGEPGDRLWVRETWKPDTTKDDFSTVHYRADGSNIEIENTQEAADRWLSSRKPEEQWPELKPPKWRPSIYMPRWASRITLEITSVRVERLQDISEYDAEREGVAPAFLDYSDNVTAHPLCTYGFRKIWHEINGQESWESNPWVWVIEVATQTIANQYVGRIS